MIFLTLFVGIFVDGMEELFGIGFGCVFVLVWLWGGYLFANSCPRAGVGWVDRKRIDGLMR